MMTRARDRFLQAGEKIPRPRPRRDPYRRSETPGPPGQGLEFPRSNRSNHNDPLRTDCLPGTPHGGRQPWPRPPPPRNAGPRPNCSPALPRPPNCPRRTKSPISEHANAPDPDDSNWGVLSTMSILVFNAGSTSLKFGLFTDPACTLLVSGALDWAGGDRHRALLTLRTAEETAAQSRTVDVPDDPAAVRCAIQALAEARPDGTQTLADIQVVGHRVVHGGAEFPQSVLIDGRGEAEHRPLVRVGPFAQSTGFGGHLCGGGRTAAGAASGGLRYGLLRAPSAPGTRLSLALRMVFRLGRAPLRFSRNQPPILCRSGGRDPAARSGRAADHQLSPGRRLLGSGNPRQCRRRLDHGLHPLGRPDDGYAARLPRSRHLLPCRSAAMA